jgi:hypothetical protein
MVKYRLARPGGEYNRLYALLSHNGQSRVPLGWPTVVAEEDGKVVGFLSTHKTKDALIAGPLVIEGKHRPWVFLRLTEAYENVLRIAGVARYVFRVSKENDKHLERVRRIGIKELEETYTHVSFVRELL